MKNTFRKLKKAIRLAPISAYRRAMSHGVAAAIEHAALISRLDLETCVDVGANVGQFTLLIRQEHPNARVLAFEPLGGPAAIYQKLFSSDTQVEFHQIALGTERKNVGMHVSRRADSSSLLPISDLQTQQFPGTEEVGRESVVVAPMTDFVSSEQLAGPSLLKIDVQGFELEVLKSAESLYFDASLPHKLINEKSRTARVLANRIWQYHFAQGIVPTSSTFGLSSITRIRPFSLMFSSSTGLPA